MRNAYQIILRQYYPPGENSISLVGFIAGDSLEEVSDRVIANLENANKNIEEVNYGETKKEPESSGDADRERIAPRGRGKKPRKTSSRKRQNKRGGTEK